MQKRYLSIWFCSLKTDWLIRRQPVLKDIPFVMVSPNHGRMMVTAANAWAQQQGIFPGNVLADARAIIPALQYFDDEPDQNEKLLNGLAEWLIRFTPVVSIDLPDGLMLDISGCTHLWGGEKEYLTEINKRLNNFGYHCRIAIAATIGTAWAVARFGKANPIVENSHQTTALLSLPPAALRIDVEMIARLEKLGLRQISQFINMPRTSLRRRFGQQLLNRLDQAMGSAAESLEPVNPIEAFYARLPCLEPIVTATGIEIALNQLLDELCKRLKQEEKGLRNAIFKGYRIDGKTAQIAIGTNRPSSNSKHLFRLFEDKIATMEPALGIELFTLDAPKTEELSPVQEKLFEKNAGLDDVILAELLDRIAGKFGDNHIQRFVPSEHYWPERSFKLSATLNEPLTTNWKLNIPRPLQLLCNPAPIEVTAPVPDYPPMNFRYKGKLHKIIKADGPERIEQEWWLQDGQHRDYYYVEDAAGCRYWLFRLGHYDLAKTYQWFVHGFFM